MRLPLAALWIALVSLAFHAVADVPTGNYLRVVNKMRSLESSHPSTVKVFEMGKDNNQTPIYGIRISTTPAQMDPKKIGHLMVATHHGNEIAAPEMAMKFMDKMVAKYNSKDLFRGQLADKEWTIIPVLNITGYNIESRHEFNSDPNRDYPGPCFAKPGGKLSSIRSMMEFMKTRIFAGSITVHGYLGALTYPWGVDVQNTHTLDHNQFDQWTAKAAAVNGYRYGTSTDLVYPVDGSYEDYAYWKHGMWSLLVELEGEQDNDTTLTAEAAFVYLDQVNSSPSVQHNMNSHCQRSGRRDLGIE